MVHEPGEDQAHPAFVALETFDSGLSGRRSPEPSGPAATVRSINWLALDNAKGNPQSAPSWAFRDVLRSAV
jgi:hypothetical protein